MNLSFKGCISNFNSQTYKKLYLMISLWENKKISEKIKQKIKKIKLEYKIYKKNTLNYYLMWNKNLQIFIIYTEGYISRINFVINKNKNKIIFLFKCTECKCQIDEDGYQYHNNIFLSKKTFVTDNICSQCILNVLKDQYDVCEYLLYRKKIIRELFSKYVNKEYSDYFTQIIYEQYIVGLDQKMFIENINTDNQIPNLCLILYKPYTLMLFKGKKNFVKSRLEYYRIMYNLKLKIIFNLEKLPRIDFIHKKFLKKIKKIENYLYSIKHYDGVEIFINYDNPKILKRQLKKICRELIQKYLINN